MREVAKSLIGFSWAVSMFGVQQLTRLVRSAATQPAAKTAAEIDEVSRAIQSHLFGAPAMQYRVGDEWARKVVDTVADVVTLQKVDPKQVVSSLDPRTVLSSVDPRKMAETGMTMFQKSMDSVKQSVDAVTQSITNPATTTEAAPAASAPAASAPSPDAAV